MNPSSSHTSWTCLGKIYSAEGRLVLEHEHGRLALKLYYCDGTPMVIAAIEFLSAELEKDVRRYALRLGDLPLLLSHAAQALRERVSQPESGAENSSQRKSAADG